MKHVVKWTALACVLISSQTWAATSEGYGMGGLGG